MYKVHVLAVYFFDVITKCTVGGVELLCDTCTPYRLTHLRCASSLPLRDASSFNIKDVTQSHVEVQRRLAKLNDKERMNCQQSWPRLYISSVLKVRWWGGEVVWSRGTWIRNKLQRGCIGNFLCTFGASKPGVHCARRELEITTAGKTVEDIKYASFQLKTFSLQTKTIFGASPSGKAAGFDPDIRRFESFRPSNKIMKRKYFWVKI